MAKSSSELPRRGAIRMLGPPANETKTCGEKSFRVLDRVKG
jgi:hypothetical protein